MLKLIRFLKDYKKECVIGPLFKFLEACFELAVPLVTAGIIDTGIKNHDIAYIYKMGGVMVFFGLAGLICSLTAQYFAAKASMGFGTALRTALFNHICVLSYTEIDEIGTPSLMTRLTGDINQTQSGVNLVLRLFLRSPFIVIGAVIMAFFVNVKLAVIFLIAAPLIGAVIYFVMSRSIPYYRRIQAILDRVSLLTRENLAGVRVIRAFSKQADETADFNKTCDFLMNEQVLAGKIAALLNPVTYVVVNAAIIALIWGGGFQVDTGSLSQGEVIALVNYMSQILLALVALANLIIAFTKASASAVRINEVFELLPSLTEKEQQIVLRSDQPRLSFENVSFAYQKSEADALTNISFNVPAGATVGVIGGTGAGKSTLMNLIGRFYDAAQGRVLIDGEDIKNFSFAALREKIGIVPQKAVLFKGTIRDNLRWRRKKASDEELWQALKIAQGEDFVRSKPDQLDTMIAQGGKNLSGGQRQRLTIARALVGRPEILILDDSASALDFATDAKLRRAIKQETQGMTVFLVSQRVSTIRNADFIVVLDDGRIVGLGKHEELMETCSVYHEICLSQLEKEVAA
ncbi:MAG: ABC transporter ATP-binding protein [Alphaproteobacteria bacterium]|nr:ABC transporter ATP-binding protein [Alphaproteobacteria bacterium]